MFSGLLEFLSASNKSIKKDKRYIDLFPSSYNFVQNSRTLFSKTPFSEYNNNLKSKIDYFNYNSNIICILRYVKDCANILIQITLLCSSMHFHFLIKFLFCQMYTEVLYQSCQH